MNEEFARIGGNALTVLILIAFFIIIYSKVKKEELTYTLSKLKGLFGRK